MQTDTAMTASADEKDRAISCLVTAFAADPFIRWMLPDAKQYIDAFPEILTHFAGGAFAHGSAYRTADFKGAALWLPPGVGPDEEALGAAMGAAIAPEMQDEVFNMLGQIGEGHPAEPHWYLPSIGVDPLAQRAGNGSALLAKSLEACDAAHDIAYLESTNPLNIPLYQRFGFEVVGEIQVGSSPVVTQMQRAAR